MLNKYPQKLEYLINRGSSQKVHISSLCFFYLYQKCLVRIILDLLIFAYNKWGKYSSLLYMMLSLIWQNQLRFDASI